MRILAAENSQQKRYRRYVKRAGGPPQMGMEDMDLWILTETLNAPQMCLFL